MAYTVKELSRLSNVTVRALHFYEEAGLLKPAYYGQNGYRYYAQKELLQLQQILFFKELGLTLNQIKKVLGQSGFNQLAALSSHRAALARQGEKIQRLLKTIDGTIEHLKGITTMKDKEFFDGFTAIVTRGKGSEPYFNAETIVGKNLKTGSTMSREAVYQAATEIFQKLVRLIDERPDAPEVQAAIRAHHHLAGQFHHATKKVYRALADLYRLHPAFRQQMEPFHPKLPDFMAAAMERFAETLK